MKKLLIIDDDELIRETIMSMLQGESFQVKAVGTIKEVFELLNSFNPDLILMDINLHDVIDGISFSHKLKEFYFENQPQIIFITGNPEVRDSDNEILAHLLLKPFVKSDLLAKITECS